MKWLMILACLIPGYAWAQANTVIIPSSLGQNTPPTGFTVTNTSAQAIAAGRYGFAEFENQNGSVTAYCRWGTAAVAAETAGQYTMPPLGGYVWDALDPPPANQALNCIAASTVQSTVRAW